MESKTGTSQCLGKKSFDTWDDAQDEVDRISVYNQMRAYQCHICKKFHLASAIKKNNIGWHSECGGQVKVIFRRGHRFCGKCLKKLVGPRYSW